MIYCSGDLGCWLENGTISISGRRDGQVKVNGFRVELEGIESALLTHPSVQEAFVTPGNSSLVAFCIPKEDGANGNGRRPSLGEVLAHIKASVPYYALPRALHWIGGILLSPSGKVDRKAMCRLYQNQLMQTTKVR